MCPLLLCGTLVAPEMEERNTNKHMHCSKVFHAFPLSYIPEGASTMYRGKMAQVNKQGTAQIPETEGLACDDLPNKPDCKEPRFFVSSATLWSLKL